MSLFGIRQKKFFGLHNAERWKMLAVQYHMSLPPSLVVVPVNAYTFAVFGKHTHKKRSRKQKDIQLLWSLVCYARKNDMTFPALVLSQWERTFFHIKGDRSKARLQQLLCVLCVASPTWPAAPVPLPGPQGQAPLRAGLSGHKSSRPPWTELHPPGGRGRGVNTRTRTPYATFPKPEGTLMAEYR